ncbi:MAG: methionyl-tRNA formyltransferase [Acidimicrobiales bacterium]
MRLVYLGTPALAVPPLQALVASGHDVALVVSAPDKRRGRGNAESPTPVKAAALDLGLRVSTSVDDALALDPPAQLGIVAAFGQIIRPHMLAALPMLNLHFSLLPRWRGAAPVERAILAGDERTGVCVMAVEEGLDTGGVYARAEVAIGVDTTADDLRAELVARGTALLLETLAKDLAAPQPQAGEATYANKIDPSELEVDWRQQPEQVHRLVRVGGAWTTSAGRRLKLWRTTLDPEAEGAVAVPCGDGRIGLLEVQPEGKGRMTAAAWVNGAHVAPDRALGR